MVNQNDYVCLLGTKGGPAIRTGSTNPTSNLLCIANRQIVVDCGLGVTRALVNQGMQLRDISTIFITHLHSDHYLELGPMLHTAWTAGLKTPVVVYGPEGLERYWDKFIDSMNDDIQLRIEDEGRPDLHSLVSFISLDDGDVLTTDTLKVTALRNIHPPLVDTFALSFKSANTHVVFSGDTAPLPALEAFSSGADLLIHEAMLEEALPALFARIGNTDDRLQKHWLRSHTFAHDAGRIATAASVRALALNHLIPSDDPEYTEDHWHDALKSTYTGKLYVGQDGLKINL
ncbi:MAG: MBL fold metallo-hydrolase [Granulosicoccus sp.]